MLDKLYESACPIYGKCLAKNVENGNAFNLAIKFSRYFLLFSFHIFSIGLIFVFKGFIIA